MELGSPALARSRLPWLRDLAACEMQPGYGDARLSDLAASEAESGLEAPSVAGLLVPAASGVQLGPRALSVEGPRALHGLGVSHTLPRLRDHGSHDP